MNCKTTILGIAIVFSSTFFPGATLASNNHIQNFVNATCVLKPKVGTRSSERAAAFMIQGIVMINPLALESWTANTGGDTYYGNIDAGRNVNAFLDWFNVETDRTSTEKVARVLISAVERQCPE